MVYSQPSGVSYDAQHCSSYLSHCCCHFIPVDVAAIMSRRAIAKVAPVPKNWNKPIVDSNKINFDIGPRGISLGDAVATGPRVFARNMLEAKKREVLFFIICDFRICGTSPGHDTIIYVCNVLF